MPDAALHPTSVVGDDEPQFPPRWEHMSNWNRIHRLWKDEKFKRSTDHEDEIVWLFYHEEPEKGAVPGRLFRYSEKALANDEDLVAREYFFDQQGEWTFPSHWQVMVTGAGTPKPPSISYLACIDGSPHDWQKKPVLDNAGRETGSFYEECVKCGDKAE
jgi:hypothetical protein